MLRLTGRELRNKRHISFTFALIRAYICVCVLTVGGDGNKRLRRRRRQRRVRCARASNGRVDCLLPLCCSVFSVSKNRSSSYDVCILRRGKILSGQSFIFGVY